MLISDTMNFFSRLERVVIAQEDLPMHRARSPRRSRPSRRGRRRLLADNSRIIEATAPDAAAYKPNLAFYEALGPAGLEALERTISIVPGDIPIILDAKRCDIDATAEAHASALFGRLRGDAVTLSPYMGRDVLDPFLKYPDKGIFMLARTSNRSASQFQDLVLAGSAERLFVKIARECVAWSDSVGLVVAGNDLDGMRPFVPSPPTPGSCRQASEPREERRCGFCRGLAIGWHGHSHRGGALDSGGRGPWIRRARPAGRDRKSPRPRRRRRSRRSGFVRGPIAR